MAVFRNTQLRALIYNGQGAGPFSAEQAHTSLSAHFRVAYCTERELAEGEWVNSTALLAIPGGQDVPYARALAGQANEQIRRFVREGGTYFGFCAGAYYGARTIAFDRGGADEILGERELDFFQGLAEGPVFGKRYVPGSESGAEAARVFLLGEELFAYYNGGCCFTGHQSAAEVLGIYADSQLSAPAVVLCRVGAGHALLSGVHIEYTLAGIHSLNLPILMEKALEAVDQRRKFVFCKLLERACLV